jgi:F-type H+-transporting ATPase subunit b
VSQLGLATALASAAPEGGGPGLTNVDWTLAVASLVLFALFAFVLGKFAWGPLLQIVEGREKSVREQVEGAQRAQAEAQVLLGQRQEQLAAAGREHDEMLARARQEAEALRAELVGKARGEADTIVERTRQQVEREKSQAFQELRLQVADLAVEGAARIVRSSLTPAAQKQLVDDFIRSLPAARQ